MDIQFISASLKDAYRDKIEEELRRSALLFERLYPDTRTDEQKAADHEAYEAEKFATEYWLV